MTPIEKAFNAGVQAVLDMARITAVTIEVRPDATEIRQRAAVAALQGLAEGGRGLLRGVDTDPVHKALKLIAKESGDGGVLPCPACSGRLQWSRDPDNGHVHGRCETTACLNWMQ